MKLRCKLGWKLEWRWMGLLLLPARLGACGGEQAPEEPARRPLLVIGLDGAERTVLETLWREGRLPHMKALAERGVYTRLETAYGKSPLIWTTIATGLKPKDHGIDGFTVPGPDGGLVPISSAQRRVPALWNITSALGLRTVVLGWWATWPVEEIEGVMVSDRVTRDVDRRVWPEEMLPRVDELVAEAARGGPGLFRVEYEIGLQDRVVAELARQLAAADFDLMMVYLRSVDTESHQYWHAWEPEAFGELDPEEVAAHRHRIPEAYEAVDQAIGNLVAAAGPETNVFVLSDHGFHAGSGKPKVKVAANQIFEELGYLTRGEDGDVDLTHTRVYSFDDSGLRHLLRFPRPEDGGTVREAEVPELRRRLEEDLAQVTYANGKAVFEARDARRREAAAGADLVLQIRTEPYTRDLLVRGRRLEGLVQPRGFVSGAHDPDTHGILIAAGPDVAERDDGLEIDIHDMAPTLLQTLGLPVGQDFVGQPHRELFTGEFRRRTPIEVVSSWGTREAITDVLTSEADQELVEELRALGYLD